MAGFLRNAAQRRVAHRARLLINFLEHEVLEAALFRHDRVPGHVLHLADDRLTVEIGQLHAFRGDDRQIAVAQEKQIAGVIENRRNVGGNKIFVFAQADDRRRAIAGRDDLVWVRRPRSRPWRIRRSAASTVLRTASSSDDWCPLAVFDVILLDHVGDDFGVGLGGELVALFDQLFLEGDVVLDDAVVHDDDLAGAIAMRVGVLFGGTSVRGPAGVANAVGAVERLQADDFFQIAQLAFGAADLQAFAIAGDCDAGGIISAIFEPLQILP